MCKIIHSFIHPFPWDEKHIVFFQQVEFINGPQLIKFTTGSQQGSGLAQESGVRVRALNRVPSEVRDGRSQASARRGWETKSNRAKASKV